MHLRRSRSIGLAEAHRQHVLTAAAMNLGRISNRLAGTPRKRTRQSAFIRLGSASRGLTTAPAVSEPGQSHARWANRGASGVRDGFAGLAAAILPAAGGKPVDAWLMDAACAGKAR